MTYVKLVGVKRGTSRKHTELDVSWQFHAGIIGTHA